MHPGQIRTQPVYVIAEMTPETQLVESQRVRRHESGNEEGQCSNSGSPVTRSMPVRQVSDPNRFEHLQDRSHVFGIELVDEEEPAT